VLPLRTRLTMDALFGLKRQLDRAGLVPDVVREAWSPDAREFVQRRLLDSIRRAAPL
jgi:hypothetical protein